MILNTFPLFRVKRSTLAIILFNFMPIAYLLPRKIALYNINISWVEIICWIALIFLSKNMGKVRGLIIWTLLLVWVTIISNMIGIAYDNVDFNIRNFSIVKYVLTYIGAILIGLHLPTKELFNNRTSYLCLLILVIMIAIAVLDPLRGELLANFYGQEKRIDAGLRVTFFDVNPNMIGQVAIVLSILSIVKYEKYKTQILLVLFMATIGFIGTQSRGNLVVLALFLLIYRFDYNRSKDLIGRLKKYLILLSPLVLAFFITSIMDISTSRVQKIGSGITERFDVFSTSISDFFISPIIGLGYRAAKGIGGIPIDYTNTTAVEVHSQWLGFLFNHGIIGLFVLSGFCLYIGRNLIRLYNIHNSNIDQFELLKLRNFLLSMYICYLVSMVGWETLYLPLYSSVFFIIFGKIFGIKNELLKSKLIREDCAR